MPKSEEQCRQMRDDMRSRILREASVYFARNGFGDTKISDLAKHIGIGQGTIYLYFKSKEELFDEIRASADSSEEIRKLRLLGKLPLPAKVKLDRISADVCRHLADDEEYCVKVTLLTQLLLESEDMYSDDMYTELAGIIRQGQKERNFVNGDAVYLADLYWGNVYLYALKRLFAKNVGALRKETLNRLLEV